MRLNNLEDQQGKVVGYIVVAVPVHICYNGIQYLVGRSRSVFEDRLLKALHTELFLFLIYRGCFCYPIRITYQQIPPVQLNRRSEEHTSELQSRGHLLCRLLLEKNKIN